MHSVRPPVFSAWPLTSCNIAENPRNFLESILRSFIGKLTQGQAGCEGSMNSG